MDRGGPRSVSLAAEWRDDGVKGASVIGRGRALNEPVALQPIRELGDVRSHALEGTGKGTEPRRLACRDQDVKGLILRDGQPHGGKRFFQATLDAPCRVEEDEYGLLPHRPASLRLDVNNVHDM